MRSCSGAGIGFAVAMVVLLQLCKWPGENVRDLHHTPSPENGRQNWSGGGKCPSERESTGSPGFPAAETDSVRFRTEHPTIAQSRWNGRGFGASKYIDSIMVTLRSCGRAACKLIAEPAWPG